MASNMEHSNIVWYNRTNITFSNNGTMVKSKLNEIFVYNEALSEIKPTDVFTVISPVPFGLHDAWIHAGKPQTASWAAAFSSIDGGELLYTTETARNLIFDIIRFEFDGINFSYGFLTNNSGSWYISHTGKDDISRMGETLKYSRDNGNITFDMNDPDGQYINCWKEPLPYSPSHYLFFGLYGLTNKLDIANYTMGTLNKELQFRYDNDCIFKGINCYAYRINETTQWYNVTQYPRNDQFYAYGKSGVWNMSHCHDELPVYISLPNFYGFPDFYKDNTKYGFRNPILSDLGYIKIEPESGTILESSIGLMNSIPATPLPHTSGQPFNYTLIYGPVNYPSVANLQMFQAPTLLFNYTSILSDQLASLLSQLLN